MSSSTPNLGELDKVNTLATDLAILFADVVGSTKLYELMGDQRARETVTHCIDLMSDATRRNHGKVVKTMGDEILATFAEVELAAQAACDMQMQISDAYRSHAVPVAVRVGFHFGPVMMEEQDVFGASVHAANRLTDQAKAGQILTTGSTVRLMTQDWQAITRQIDITRLRGQSDETEVFELLWQQEETTRLMPAFDWRDAARASKRQLRVRYRDEELVINEQRPTITIGRGDLSDIVIKDTLISRQHARIEYNRGHFTLIDQSTNGTCVRQADGREQFVKRDSITIAGEGQIGLGRVPQDGSPQAIYFSQED